MQQMDCRHRQAHQIGGIGFADRWRRLILSFGTQIALAGKFTGVNDLQAAANTRSDVVATAPPPNP